MPCPRRPVSPAARWALHSCSGSRHSWQPPARKALTDRAALRAVLAEHGAELVLHGHSRDARFDPLRGPQGLIASFGLPSISAIPNPRDEGSRWHLLTIEKTTQGWQLGVTVRVLDAAAMCFVTAAQYALQVPPSR